jgi:hypothetical protein
MNPQLLLHSTRFASTNDPWFCHDGRLFHAYLQGIGNAIRPEDRRYEGGIAHLTSTDGLRWLELNPVLTRGAAGTDDDADLYSGSTLYHDGTFYLYYTGRRLDEEVRIERIFLAVSTDGIHFERVAGNPILTADPAHYEAVPQDSPDGIVNFRDPDVIFCPEDQMFYMVFGARSADHQGVLGLAKSTHPLTGWELCPPLYRSTRSHMMECPHWMRVGSRYAICYSQVLRWVTAEGKRSVPPENIEDGIYYVQGEHPLGPFDDSDTRALIGSSLPSGKPYSAAPVTVGERTFLAYNLHGSKGYAPFKEVVAEDGRIVLKWNRDLETFCGQETPFAPHFECGPGPGYRFSQARVIGHNGLVTGTLRRGASRQAGILFRADEYGWKGIYAAWDFERGAVIVGAQCYPAPLLTRYEPDFFHRDELRFRLMFLDDNTELYLDDRLVLSTGPVWESQEHSRIGVVDVGGAAEFEHLVFRPMAMSDGRMFW